MATTRSQSKDIVNLNRAPALYQKANWLQSCIDITNKPATAETCPVVKQLGKK